jgi:hypothetical protein
VAKVLVPDAISALDLLDKVSYEDRFAATTPTQRTAEEWGRATIEAAPAWLLVAVRLAQRLLGLQLEPSSDEHPLGWTILRNEPDLFILGADGRRGGTQGSARLVCVTTPTSYTIATQADFGLATRALWIVLGPGHRAIARALIARAVRDSDSRTDQ